jgi:hypothetical protein
MSPAVLVLHHDGMKRKLLLLLVLVVPLCAFGWFKRDKKPQAESAKRTEITAADLPAGYALLFDLLSDEKNVSKLLLIKKESDPLDKIINAIADAAKDAHKKLEKFGKSGRLNLEDQQLPVLETATRESIAKEKAQHLLKSKGAEFEFYLLSTQQEALTYGTHLARCLAKAESDPARHEFLSKTAARLDELREGVSRLLNARRE